MCCEQTDKLSKLTPHVAYLNVVLNEMKKTISTILLIFIVQILTFGQNENLPKEVSISDKFFSPWGTNLEYRYKLELIEGKYEIIRTFQNENGKHKRKQKKIGNIEANEIERLIDLIKTDSTYELNFKNFSEKFTQNNASDFIKENGDNYWITSDIQKEFLLDNLTKPNKVENNLKSYFRDYDQSGWIDGSSTEISISFIYRNINVTIVTKSILEYALPININNKDHYNPELSRIIAKIIPSSKTNRQLQLSGNGLFNSIAKETISNNRRKLDGLEVLSYTSEIDSLKKHFKVTNLRVVNGTSSTNWNGEKRFNCQLWDTSNNYNVSIMYSSKIDSNKVMYPPSIIIDKYENLVPKLLTIDFFRNYLLENDKRKISIIFDDNTCFTVKTKERVLGDCKNEIDFDNSLFLAVWTENSELSNWIVLPNGKYILWMEISGSAITPNDDNNFIECKE